MKLLTVAAMAFTLLAGSVNAAEQLNAYSIMPEKYASKVFAEFTKDTGIKVNFMRFSSGEALARLNAEKLHRLLLHQLQVSFSTQFSPVRIISSIRKMLLMP